MIFTVVFALVAAFSNAANVMTQHAASISAPKRETGLRLVRYLFRQPLWLLGWIAAVGGFGFQALALHNGQLSVVQPILVTELVFVLALRSVWIRQAVARAAWAAGTVVCAALAVFLAVAEPSGGKPDATTADWLAALLVFGGAAAAAIATATRGSPARRAAAFATAGSLAWALMAVFLKSTTDTLTAFGFGGLFTHWPLYALAVAAISATLLEQAALHVGPLSVSQPLLVIINPLASIVLSIWLFDERFTASPARIVVAVLAFAVLAVAVVQLSRAAPSDLAPSPAAAGDGAGLHLAGQRDRGQPSAPAPPRGPDDPHDGPRQR
jgi:drug/metabolite transporter (DMT)-like permease